MRLIGKAIVDEKDIESILHHFDEVEIGLRKEDLVNYERTEKFLDKYEDCIFSIHTPHLPYIEKPEYLVRCDELSSSHDKLLVVDSYQIQQIMWSRVLEKISMKSYFCVENQAGSSYEFIINHILKNYNLCLDIPHLYISHPTTFKQALSILTRDYKEKIKIVHLTDATPYRDTLPLGKGEIPLGYALSRVKDMPIVIELMPEDQYRGKELILNLWHNYIANI